MIGKKKKIIRYLEKSIHRKFKLLIDLNSESVGYFEEEGEIVGLSFYDCGIKKISDLNGLEYLPHLKSLYLRKNQISKINGLERLPFLKNLNLRYNKITEISGLEFLTHLQILNLESNNIIKIKGLKSLLQLHYLNLGWNGIYEIYGLEELTQLQHLDLSYNKIWEIYGLEGLTQLQHLDLSNNNIRLIRGLNYLSQLKILDLKNNNIKEIKGLEKLTNLNELKLSGNPLIKPFEILSNDTEKLLSFSKQYEYNLVHWDGEKIMQKIHEGEQLTFLDKHHPDVPKLFPRLNINDKDALDQYRKWNPQIILDKLKINEYPSQFDLQHYLFLKNWHDIEHMIKEQEIDNNATRKFLSFLEERFSIDGEEGFKILL